jgi:hypothetical protein
MNPRFSPIRRVVPSRVATRNLHLSCKPADVLPISALLRIPGPAGYLKTEQGRSCCRKGFLVVSPDCHTPFGYVFYDDMNKKPVAQSQTSTICWGLGLFMGCYRVFGLR